VLREARESGRLNMRRQATPRVRAAAAHAELLVRLEQAVAETRSMARTISRTGGPAEGWDPSFRDAWLGLLGALGTSITTADATAVARVRADVEDAGEELLAARRGDRARPVHGALLVNLRNIAEAMDAVAEAQPVSV
jgi:hypothetical protein